jgi:hypothetical protein
LKSQFEGSKGQRVSISWFFCKVTDLYVFSCHLPLVLMNIVMNEYDSAVFVLVTAVS